MDWFIWVGGFICNSSISYSLYKSSAYFQCLSLDPLKDESGQVDREARTESMHGQAIRRNCLLISEGKPFKCLPCFMSHWSSDGGRCWYWSSTGLISGTCLIGPNSMSLLSHLVYLTLDRWLTVYRGGVDMVMLPKINNTAWKFFLKLDFIPLSS